MEEQETKKMKMRMLRAERFLTAIWDRLTML
jgi:hypothetical protein